MSLDGASPRMPAQRERRAGRRTPDAISADLVTDSLVHRYDPARSPDGLDGDEGTLSMCRVW
jgi:hypothetical protein